MRALTWQSRGSVRVQDVPEAVVRDPTDAVISVTSTAICGSDLHLLDVLAPFLDPGDVLGHETMGVVLEVGDDVTSIVPGDRVVIPFVIACGHCLMCRSGWTTQCETTQNRDQGTGAALYGYTQLYGSVPGGQAELLRVPFADANAVKVGSDLPDEQYLFLSDILPTAWQAVEYTGAEPGQSVLVLGLGPVGQLAARIARYRGCTVIGVDLEPERRALAQRHGIDVLDPDDHLTENVLDRTEGRGPHAVIDAVGMEAHGSPAAAFAQNAVGILPDAAGRALTKTVGLDRLAALLSAIELVRRGGTVSIAGVYGGVADPLPMMTMFDKGITLRMGQCTVHRWIDELMPIVEDPADPLAVADIITHHAPLEDAAELYTTFRDKADGCVKVVLHPAA